MRYVTVAYGDVSRVQLKASSKPQDALVQLGFDVYLEITPKRWVRAVDLPQGHPAFINFSQGSYKAGIVDSNGRMFTILNAYNPEHKALAAREGLIIANPISEQKREALIEKLENIKAQLREWTEITELKQQIETLQQKLRNLPSLEEKQKTWDGTINQTLTLASMLEELVKASGMSTAQREFQEAVKRAKKEAALESAIEESLLLNPDLIRSLKELAVS